MGPGSGRLLILSDSTLSLARERLVVEGTEVLIQAVDGSLLDEPWRPEEVLRILGPPRADEPRELGGAGRVPFRASVPPEVEVGYGPDVHRWPASEFDGEILGEAPAILEVLGSDAYGPLSRRNKGYHLRPEAQEALIGHWASWARRTGRCLLLCGGWNNMGPKAPSRVYRGSSPGRGKREAFLGTETALELRRAYFEASIRRILEAYLYGRLPDEPREELPRPEESKIRLLEGRVGSRLQGASGSFPQGLTREGVQEEELRASAELLRGWLESEPTCSSHGSSFWIDCLPKDYPYYGSRPIRGLYAWIEALVVRTGLVEYDLDEASRSGGRRAVRASRGSRDGGLPESEERLFPSEESKRLRGPAEGRIQTSAESGIWASAVKLRTWLLGEPSCVAYGSSYWIECLPRDYPHYEGRPSRRLRAWIDALVETGLVGYDFEEAQRPGGRPAIRAVRGLEVPD